MISHQKLGTNEEEMYSPSGNESPGQAVGLTSLHLGYLPEGNARPQGGSSPLQFIRPGNSLTDSRRGVSLR